jgi:hypothetical protein
MFSKLRVLEFGDYISICCSIVFASELSSTFLIPIRFFYDFSFAEFDMGTIIKPFIACAAEGGGYNEL